MSVTFKADVLPGLLEECIKYMHASKWYNLEKLDIDLVRFWVPQLSLWTRSAFKTRGHVYANCPHPNFRMALLEIVGEEDVVDPRVGMNHRQLMATTMGKACGMSLEDLEKARPLPTTLITFDILYALADRSWIEGIAMNSGIERIIQESGYFGYEARRLQRDLGWSDEAIGWFSGHDEADEEHGKLIEMLDDYVTDDDTWDRIRETILEGWIAWWLMFDGVLDAYNHDIKTVRGLSCKGLSTIF